MTLVIIFTNLSMATNHFYKSINSKTFIKGFEVYLLYYGYTIQPLATWLFTWQYFVSVSSLLEKQLPKWVQWLIDFIYVFTTLALLAAFLAIAVLMG